MANQVPYAPLPQVAPTGAPGGDYLQIQGAGDPASFGAAVGRGEQQLGAGLEEAGRTGFEAAYRRQELTNEINSNKLMTQTMDQYTAAWADFAKVRGVDAQDAYQGYSQRVQKISDDALAAAPNLQTQRMLSTALRYQTDYYKRIGESHAAQQFETGFKETKMGLAKSLIDQSIQAGINNPGGPDMEVQLRGAIAARADVLVHQGAGKEAIEQDGKIVVGHVIANIAEQKAANGDVQGALAVFKSYRDRMDAGSQLQIENKLRPAVQQMEGVAIVDKIFGKSAAGTAAPPAPGATPPGAVRTGAPTDSVSRAIIGQESGNRDSVPASVAGAVGPGQVMPDTFRQYAQQGEDINNPADNRAVSQRIVADLMRRTNGDPARVAVGYFSGPGNIAPPGSATPWINDTADATGKTTSSYVADVTRRLGATDAAAVPGTNIPAPGMPPRASVYDQINEAAHGDIGVARAAFAYADQQYRVRQAAYVDEERAMRLAEKQRKDASEQAEDGVIADTAKPIPQITAQAIANDPKLLPEAKLRMLAFVNRAEKGEPPAEISRRTSIHLLDDLRRPDGDPRKITDMGPIYDEFSRGNLSRPDFDFIKREFVDNRSADGAVFGQQLKTMVDRIKPQIDHSNPMQGKIDQTGPGQLYQYEWMIKEKVDEYKKAGKNPWDLLNPKRPDYLGSPAVVAQFAKPLQESVADQVNKLTMQPPPPAAKPVATSGAAVAMPMPPDLTSKEGVQAAYRAGKITREDAAKTLRENGWAE